MSKNRWVNTRFWTDTYISGLDPIEKLLFLYLITNEDTALCGAYEIPLKRIAADTGIDKEMVEKILQRFSSEDKIHYVDGYIIIRNYRKHQVTNTNIQSGIEREENELPERIKESLLKPLEDFERNPIPILNPIPIPKPKHSHDNITKKNKIKKNIEINIQDLGEHPKIILWKNIVGTTLRSNLEKQISIAVMIEEDVGEKEFIQLLHAVRIIRQDKFAGRSLQIPLVNYSGLQKKLQEVEAYMQGMIDNSLLRPKGFLD